MAEPTPVAPSDDGVVSASERFPEPFSPRLGWPILATCAGWALAYALLPLRYATNDDLAIVSSLRHGNETIFLSHLLNRALIALYRWLPEVPWFSGLVIAATIVGIALMVAAIRRRADDWTMPIAALLPLGLFGLECVAFTSFTSAALLLELGVVLTLFESALFGERPATSLLVALVSAALVSYGLRWRLFLLFLPFAVPLLLFAGRPLRRRLIVAVLCLGAVVAVDRGLARWQQSDEFRGYEAYNFARSRFHDTDGGSVFGPSTYRAAALVGWTRVDLHIYQIWIT
ncbi:MAG: hypothetical protein KC609_19705, partial [Myxococcales bacterium]|nr:hypothetical protein [Myxococcales bacterium]